jgi:integrase
VKLAAFYGLKRSEIVGLKWDAIDFKNRTITIRHTVTDTVVDGKLVTVVKDRTKNKASYRTLPLVDEFYDMLSSLKEYQIECQALCRLSYNTEHLEYICVDEMGNRIKPNFITQNFQLALTNNNLRQIRFHDLRHTAASLLLNAGVSMKEIQEWLGHSDFGTTANIYGHLDVNAKTRSADAMRATGMNLAS